ncbi:hypothetical protein C0J52_13237 [Blattella germanica]|nr:hypothetical protein C0J52_13237 [Blattella germanica]
MLLHLCHTAMINLECNPGVTTKFASHSPLNWIPLRNPLISVDAIQEQWPLMNSPIKLYKGHKRYLISLYFDN